MGHVAEVDGARRDLSGRAAPMGLLRPKIWSNFRSMMSDNCNERGVGGQRWGVGIKVARSNTGGFDGWDKGAVSRRVMLRRQASSSNVADDGRQARIQQPSKESIPSHASTQANLTEITQDWSSNKKTKEKTQPKTTAPAGAPCLLAQRRTTWAAIFPESVPSGLDASTSPRMYVLMRRPAPAAARAPARAHLPRGLRVDRPLKDNSQSASNPSHPQSNPIQTTTTQTPAAGVLTTTTDKTIPRAMMMRIRGVPLLLPLLLVLLASLLGISSAFLLPGPARSAAIGACPREQAVVLGCCGYWGAQART